VHQCSSMERDHAHRCNNGGFHEFCNTLVSSEARAFIDNHDKNTPLILSYPSKTIIIAELMILQSKFGIPISAAIIAK